MKRPEPILYTHFECCYCSGIFEMRHGGHRTRYCMECIGPVTKIRRKAYAAVRRAIWREELVKPSKLKCHDCGAPAVAYDHADYTRPLDVQPVCNRCNSLRGPANLPPHPLTTAP